MRSKASVILRLIYVYFFDMSSTMLKVAFSSFKISNFLAENSPRTPYKLASPALACWPPLHLNTKYAPPSLSV